MNAPRKNPKLIYSYMNRHLSARENKAALMDFDNKIVTDKAGLCGILNDFFF